MTRNFKALGLALVAAMVLAAVGASGAMALTPKFQVGTGDGNITGTQIGKMRFTFVGGRTVECSTVKFASSLAASSSTLEKIVPTYSNCESMLAGIKIPATITVNGCTYTIHLGAATGVTDQYSGTTDIVCPEGKVIEFHIYKEETLPAEHITANQLCGYSIASQAGLGALSLTNVTTGNPKDIVLGLNLSKIKYTRTIGTIPNCGPASAEATLKGEVTFSGTTTAGVATDAQITEV